MTFWPVEPCGMVQDFQEFHPLQSVLSPIPPCPIPPPKKKGMLEEDG